MFANEVTFKVVLGVLFVTYSLVRRHFQRTLVFPPVESAHHEERERILFVLVSATLIPIVLYVVTPFLDSLHLDFEIWLRWLGALFILAGISLFYAAHSALGTNWSGVLEVREGHELVKDGPYRYVRHPMYSAMLAIGLGMGLLSANVAVWSYFAVVLFTVLVRIGDEEAMLESTFGEDYARYRKGTGRVLPSRRSLTR